MRPGDPVHAVGHDLAAAADVIEVTVNFDQADIGYLSVDIVTQHAVIVLYDAILVRSTRNELALCVKGIGSFLHQTVHSGAVVGLVHDQLALAVGIVVIITNLDHACRSLDAVDIVEEVFAILQDPVLAGVLVVQNDAVFIEVVAPLRKRKAIGLMEPAILAVQHSALHCCREVQAFTLLQILLDCEVIIVDLAILLDNALQTGFFFEDAAVEPIGIRSDAVNTGNIALEYAFRIKDTAGFFRCSIGDQRRDSGSYVSSFGVQIVDITVNARPTGLLQFTVLVVLLAVHIRKPAVPELPLCIQRHISGQFKNCALIGIGGSAAICGSVPADELVVLTGKGVGIQGSIHTDFKALRLHTAFAAVGIEGDGVEHTGSCRVLCRISGILFSNHNLRAPAGEGVAVVVVRILIRTVLEGRHGALQIIFLSYDLAINYPSDMCAGLRNFRALFQQFIADSAVCVTGVTGCRKRCFDRIANLRLVAGRRDYLLFNKHFPANITVLALGQTRFRTGRSLCLVNDFGVTLGRNLGLCNDNLIADRAVLALGQTSLRAGRSLCCIDYFCVAGRRDFFHTGEDCLTNGALRTGFMASLGAGSGLFRNFNRSMSSCVDCFGPGCIANCAGVGLDTGVLTGRRGRDLALIPAVALGGNLFLRNKNFVADGTVLTLSLAGFRAGRLNGSINDLGMALSLNGLALGDFFAADGADRITGVAVLGAGGILLVNHLGERMIVLPLSIKSGVLGQINSRAIRIGVTSTIGRRIPVQEVVAFTGKRVCVQCGIRLCIYGLWGHRAFDRVFRTSIGFKGNRQLRRLFAAPNAIDIVDNIASVCGRSFRIGSVGVMQLGSGDGDSHRTAARVILIGCGRRAGCALLNVLAGAVAGADIRTTPGGIDSTNSCYTAVHIHLGIDQIVVRTVICLARRIGHGLKLAGAPDKVVGVPLIAVIEIDILPVCNRQASALGNIDLNARQQSCILIDGHIAGLNIDGNVVGDRQYVACRVDIHACKRQRQRVQCRLAVYCEYKTICLFIVILGKATGFHFEHTGVANEINSSSICGAHCINAAINLFIGAGIQRQGNFDVLYEVLRKWEHPMAHAGRCAAAAEVCNLIEFIHRSARFRQNRAAAGDKAPCIEITAVLDCNGAVIRHFDIAVIANGTSLLTAASSIISAAQADGAIDGDRSAFAHRQRSERLRSCGCANCRRSIRIQRSRLIKRNQ